jgi:RNA polymerase subunit RPABC4/transcription elongation factor Spt4
MFSLTGDSTSGEILRLHGLAPKADKAPNLTIRICPRCQEKVSSASKFCQRCGSPMNPDEWILEEKREAADKLLNLLLDDPEVRSLIARKLSELDKERFQASAEKLIKP